MTVSIIIVNWNTTELLVRCLDSIYLHPPHREFEIIVVDNASNDASLSVLSREFRELRLIRNRENVGFARANNRAIKSCESEFVLLLNPDVVVLAGSLETLVESMKDRPSAGIAGATLLNSNGSFQASYNDFPSVISQVVVVAGLANRIYGPHFPSHDPTQAGEIVEADWVGGACLIVRREAVDEVGMLDEDYFMYAEEMDWCFRMRKAGWDILSVPGAKVVHWGGQASRQTQRLIRARLAYSAFIFFRKHYGLGSAIAFRAAATSLGLAKAIAYFASFVMSLGTKDESLEKLAANLHLVAWSSG